MSRKLVKFVILFDNTNVLYFPGQFLSGRVIVELNDDTPILGLHFHVVGEGIVKLKSDKAFDKENYIDFRMRLLGDPGQPPVLLSPGIHSFPFKLGLPLGLPSTFLGKHGWVQYFCKSALRESSGLIHRNQQVFVVINPIDLNTEPAILSQPFVCDINHKFGMNCVTSGEVSCRVTLDRGGYIPGETIFVNAIIRNKSKITIKNTKATLMETVKYMARNKLIHSESREIAAVSRGKIRPGHVDEWKEEQLFVPPLPPSNLRGCHSISVLYDVYFVVKPKGLENEIKLQLPILIGTYPFHQTEEEEGEEEKQYPTMLPIVRPWFAEKKSRKPR